MNKKTFLQLFGKAYHFPEYYALNLDSAEEIVEDRKEETGTAKLSLRHFFDELLAEEKPEEREKIWAFLQEHFELGGVDVTSTGEQNPEIA